MDDQQATALVERFNQVTSKIAAKMRKLEEERARGGLTAEREAQLQTQMLSIAEALDLIGSDSTNPVPDDDPVPEIEA